MCHVGCEIWRKPTLCVSGRGGEGGREGGREGERGEREGGREGGREREGEREAGGRENDGYFIY